MNNSQKESSKSKAYIIITAIVVSIFAIVTTILFIGFNHLYENFFVYWISYPEEAYINDTVIDKAEIKKLNREYPNIVELRFVNCEFKSNADLSKLHTAEMDYLTFIDCTFPEGYDISDMAGFNTIKYLDLAGNNLSDYSFVKKAKNIENLRIVGNDTSYENINLPTNRLSELRLENINGVSLSDICELQKLNRLTLLGCTVKDEETAVFPRFISVLIMSDCEISDASFLENSEFSQLYVLDLSDNPIKDASFLQYANNDFFTSLDLSNTDLTKDSFSYISECASLRVLNMSNVPMTDLSVIKDMNELETLVLSGCGIESSENGNLSEKSIKKLYFDGNNIDYPDSVEPDVYYTNPLHEWNTKNLWITDNI